MQNKLTPKHQLVLDGLITKVHNLQDADDKLKAALIKELRDNIRQSVKDVDDIFIDEDGLIGTGMGWDEVYVNFLKKNGYSNMTYRAFQKLSEDEQENILENTDIAKIYFQIFCE